MVMASGDSGNRVLEFRDPCRPKDELTIYLTRPQRNAHP